MAVRISLRCARLYSLLLFESARLVEAAVFWRAPARARRQPGAPRAAGRRGPTPGPAAGRRGEKTEHLELELGESTHVDLQPGSTRIEVAPPRRLTPRRRRPPSAPRTTTCSARAATALCVLFALAVLVASRGGPPPAAPPQDVGAGGRQHQVSEVSEHAARWRRSRPRAGGAAVHALVRARRRQFAPGPNEKRVHFVRHGEARTTSFSASGAPSRLGRHDGALHHRQRSGVQVGDAQLTAVGTEQAQARARGRRAGRRRGRRREPDAARHRHRLLAFEAHVAAGKPILASELLHERGGRHTCDKRLGLAAIARRTRTLTTRSSRRRRTRVGRRRDARVVADVASRAAEFCKWLAARRRARRGGGALGHAPRPLQPSSPSDPECKKWFGTGEMEREADLHAE